MLRGTMNSLRAEEDTELARVGLQSNLKLLEGLIRVKPHDFELLTMAAEGFTGYALMFLEDVDNESAMLMYERAKEYGLRALAKHNGRFLAGDLKYNEFTQLVDALSPKYVHAAYLTGMAWAGRINLQKTSPKAMAEFPRAVHLMTWVLERSEHHYYSAPHWFFGVYYSTLPPMLGGNPELSNKHFTIAMEENGDDFLLGKYLYAKTYAVQILDRDLFEELLNLVINSNTPEPEELILLNRIARQKSLILLDQADELF